MDLLAISFDEGVISAGLFDPIEVFPGPNKCVRLLFRIRFCCIFAITAQRVTIKVYNKFNGGSNI